MRARSHRADSAKRQLRRPCQRLTLCLFHSPYRHRSPAGDFLHVSSLADDRRTEMVRMTFLKDSHRTYGSGPALI
jgi:hypothetical protein